MLPEVGFCIPRMRRSDAKAPPRPPKMCWRSL